MKKTIVANLTAKVAKSAANKATGRYSLWGFFQPKVPKSLKK